MRWLLPYLVAALCVSISCGNIEEDYDGSGSGDIPDYHKTPHILPDSKNVPFRADLKQVNGNNDDIDSKIDDTQNANEDTSGNVTKIEETVDEEENDETKYVTKIEETVDKKNNTEAEQSINSEATVDEEKNDETEQVTKIKETVDKKKNNEIEQSINSETGTTMINTTLLDANEVLTTTVSTSTTSKTTTSKATTSKTKSTSKPTTQSTPKPTTIPTTSTTEATSNKAASFFNFNLNYLYFLLLLIPLAGIITGIIYFCKRKKRKDYTNPNVRADKPRRFSTPSWVFSEPDFADEEVITLEEEKK